MKGRTIMKTRIPMLLSLLVLMPAGVMAQTAEERIDAAFVQAEEAGIPVSLLESKIAEGHAKGIPMDQIAMATEQRLKGLARARDAMARGADDLDAAQVSVATDALGNGVSEAVLEEIANTTPRERRTVALAALAHLVEEGIAPAEALARVNDALERNVDALARQPAVAEILANLPAPVEVGPPASVTPGQREAPQRPTPRGPPGGGA
jgi:hypothetical protein